MKWRTKDGTEMSIHEMSDTHLLNAIAYLKKRAPKCAEEVLEIPDFDGMERTVYLNRREILADWGYFKLLAEKRKRRI